MIRSADARAYTEVARGPSSVKDDRPVSLHAAGGRDEADAVHGKRLPVVLLAALGIVFGDIGTGPLYTMREAFGPAAACRFARPRSWRALPRLLGARPGRDGEVLIIMRADNQG